MPKKSVQLGKRPHYPIVITKLHKKVGDTVKKQDKIFEFKYSWKRELEEDKWSRETTYNDFESPAEGVIKEWRIHEGDKISADMEAMIIDEACGHEVQMHGMCSLCGADMTEANWAAEELEADRARINMTHDQTGLMVSDQVAEKAEYETQKSLIRSRKLSLVVDLDQTIIHACVDPTVEKWMSDPSSPNHAVVQDIKSFWLDDAGGGQTYYIKLRPGLQDFLETVAEQYEMHVYTMGTRAYARNIAKFIDPDKRYFGNRIISRNENGSHSTKQLQRLFPVSTDMVVIIDDRADVWPMNERNLIKVTPFDFFKGQGDLNSPFAPQLKDVLPALPQTPPEKTPATVTNGGIPPEATKTSPIETLAKMGGGDDEALLSSQKAEHDKAVEKQVTEQPLLHMQEELEKDEKEVTQDHRPQLLVDDDEELIALQDHLNDIHAAFYETYNRKKKELRGSDEPHHLPGQTKPRKKSQEDIIDLSLVPDVGDIMTDLKSSVLEGLVLCLSGLIPMGVSVERSEIGRLAESFGAQVVDAVSKRVTHLVVATSRPRTKKVQQAAKIPSIDIVNQNWLTDCMSQWRRLETEPYFLTILPADREGGEDTTAGNTEDEADAAVVDLKDFNWAAADEELEDLSDTDEASEAEDDMDVDVDEAGTGSETDTSSSGKKGGRKRKVLASADESDTESVLAKKQRIARSRGVSSLRSVRTPNGDEEVAGEDGKGVNSSSLPTPGPTGDEEDAGNGDVVNPDGGEDFDEDELERELMAEFNVS